MSLQRRTLLQLPQRVQHLVNGKPIAPPVRTQGGLMAACSEAKPLDGLGHVGRPIGAAGNLMTGDIVPLAPKLSLATVDHGNG